MPECNGCGKSCGNKGALKSHEAHCDALKAQSQTQAAQPEPPAENPPQQHYQEQHQRPPPPATQQQPPQQNLPAQQQPASNHLELGANVGQQLANVSGGSPEEKAQAEGQIFQTIGAAIASFGSKKMESKLEDINRAKERDGGVKKATGYVPCPECEQQLTELPPEGHEFNCPACGVLLES